MSARKYPFAVFFAVGLILSAVAFTTSAAASAPAATGTGYPPGNSASLSSSTSTVAAGGTITVTGTHFRGVVTLTATDAAGQVVVLGTVTAGVDGEFITRITLPAGEFPPGSYVITASDKFGDVESITITTTSGSASNPGTGGGLPFTGFAVGTIGGIGVLFLLGGGLVLLAGRRRKGTV